MKLRRRTVNPHYEQVMLIENLDQPLLPVERDDDLQNRSPPRTLPTSECTYESDPEPFPHPKLPTSDGHNTVAPCHAAFRSTSSPVCHSQHPQLNNYESDSISGCNRTYPTSAETDILMPNCAPNRSNNSSLVHAQHPREDGQMSTVATKKKDGATSTGDRGRQKYKSRKRYRNMKRRARRDYLKFCRNLEGLTYGYCGFP